MSHTPNFDQKIKPILGQLTPGPRTCPITGETWSLTEEEISWLKHFNVPPSDIKPLIRRRWLHGFNAGLNIWWNTHALTGERLLSYIHPDNKIRPIPDKEWYTIDWGEKYFSDVDPTQSFFEQMRKLVFQVPATALRTYGEAKNSIGVGIISAEDSFMVFAGIVNVKNSRYCYIVKDAEEIMDCFDSYYCTESLGLSQCVRMNNCLFALQSADCRSCNFIFDCRNCENCFLSSNLRNRQYVFDNEQLTKDAYEQKIKEVDLGNYEIFKKVHENFLGFLKTKAIWPESFNLNATESTGEYLNNCLRSHEAYICTDATDCYEGQMSHGGMENSAFFSGATRGNSEVYMGGGVAGSRAVKFSTAVVQCQDIEYCHACSNCQFCFGCVGLANKKFCIMNKQYSEEEYWKKVDEVKCAMLDRGEYGRFFPGDFSHCGMEFSTDIYLDYTQAELDYFGAPHFDPLRGNVVSENAMSDFSTLTPADLPISIFDPTVDSFIGKPIIDPELKRPFTIRKEDVDFYRRHNLALPREHFFSRLRRAARMCNVAFTRHQETCRHCQKEISVVGSPVFAERVVYCNECYLKYLEQNN